MMKNVTLKIDKKCGQCGKQHEAGERMMREDYGLRGRYSFACIGECADQLDEELDAIDEELEACA